MTHQSSHIIIQRLSAQLFYGDASPATGVGAQLAKCQVWHVVVAAFALGLILGLLW